MNNNNTYILAMVVITTFLAYAFGRSNGKAEMKAQVEKHTHTCYMKDVDEQNPLPASFQENLTSGDEKRRNQAVTWLSRRESALTYECYVIKVAAERPLSGR